MTDESLDPTTPPTEPDPAATPDPDATTTDADPSTKRTKRTKPTALIVTAIVLGAILLVLLIWWIVASLSADDGATPEATESPEPTPTVTVTTGPEVLDPCATDATALRAGESDVLGGATRLPLIFENSGSVGCTLSGFPRVAFALSPGTTQVGPEAVPDSSSTARTVTLAAGGTAQAMLMVTDAGAIDGCEAQDVDGFSITLPGASGAVFLPVSGYQSCGDAGPSQLAVTAVEAPQ
jgi:hypothetical protein